MKLTNGWNKFIYRIWSPGYDVLDRFFFAAGRRRALQLLNLKSGESVLSVGVGMGADLPDFTTDRTHPWFIQPTC